MKISLKTSFGVKCGDKDLASLSKYASPFGGIWAQYPQVDLIPQIPQSKYNSIVKWFCT